MNSHLPDDLILLVGSNPLPNYVAAELLQPKRVHLVHSEETREVCQRLAACLQSRVKCEAVNSENYRIGDAGSVSDIRRIAERLPAGCALNYTGGTKVMAAHVLDVWKREREGCDAWASYLDDKSDKLRFDDGREMAIGDGVSILLKTLTDELHSLDVTQRSVIEGGPTDDDASRLAVAAVQNVLLPSRLYPLFGADNDPGTGLKASELRLSPKSLSGLNLALSAAEIPGNDWKTKRIECWRDFLRGEWLEDFVAMQITRLRSQVVGVDGGSKNWEIHKGVKDNSKKNFEVDVVLMRGHRLFAVSCTTEAQDHHLCKSKLFEVAMRARQLGGDLARFAFVCLLDRDSKGNDWASILEDKIGSGWESHFKPRVFGLRHVREWVGTNGADGNLTSLQQWLNQ